MDDEILNSLWVEKYRPKTLNDVVLEDKQKEFLSRNIEKGEIPHLSFFGPPGSGKTSTAQILISYIIKDDMDLMVLSGQSDATMEVAKNDIPEFAKSPPFGSLHKIIFIDEVDGTSHQFQKQLRSITEKYCDNLRFIITGNDKSLINPAIFSRFQHFDMDTISKDFALEFCENILTKEEISYNKDEVVLVIESLLPDVRKIVNVIQQNTDTTNKKFEGADRKDLVNIENKIVGLFVNICDEFKNENPQKNKINSNISDIENTINQNDIDYTRIYQELFYSEIPAWAKICINKYAKQHNECFIPNMHFISCVYEMIQNAQRFREYF